MDPQRKSAYRFLLSECLLEIRSLSWQRGVAGSLPNPFAMRRQKQQLRHIGVLADWLHNLAISSADDFQSFDEDLFWQQLDDYQRVNPTQPLQKYRQLFTDRLSA